MKPLKLVLFFLLLTQGLYSQNGFLPTTGARGIAMGNTGLCFTDIHSAYANPAGLAFLKQFESNISAESRFSISELQNFSAAAAYPFNSGTFALSLNHFGFELYKEQRFGLAYGRKLFPNLSIGGQFLVLNTSIPEYGNKSNFTFELGAISQLLPHLKLGLHLYSPVRIKVLDDEYLPSIFSLGLSYDASSKLLVNLELEKQLDYELRLKGGIEYRIIEELALRTGLITNPFSSTFGAGYYLKSGLSIDLASSWHEYLGLSPAIGISFRSGRKGK